MSRIPEEMKELKEFKQVFALLSSARGHVSYLCASRGTKALVRTPSPPGFKFQRVNIARPTWIISGRDTTSDAGQATIDICEYLHVPECAPLGFDYDGPAIIDERPAFLTSLHSEQPVVVSTKIEATAQEGGQLLRDMLDSRVYLPDEVEYKVKATVRTWKLDGTPAAGVDFSWVCIAEGAVRCFREM
jgi:hypothetical protein